MSTDWNKRFVELSEYIAQWSKDKSTKTGAVIADNENRVLSIGYNGFPAGVNDDIESRHERPEKYLWTKHAEENAILNAGRIGVSVVGATIFLNWFPCAKCAGSIAQSGIKKVVCKSPEAFVGIRNEKVTYDYSKEFKIATDIFFEKGIELIVIL